ncbi:MAG: hypothetical protein ACR2ND_06390 [Solirubrobacteraceae bacterium]
MRRGPFAGLEYPREIIAHAGFVPSKLLGSYEFELHHAIEDAVLWNPDIVANVGSGDGYFTVGFAKRLPDCVAIGYETDTRERRSARRLAFSNQASATFVGTCSPQSLRTLERTCDRCSSLTSRATSATY